MFGTELYWSACLCQSLNKGMPMSVHACNSHPNKIAPSRVRQRLNAHPLAVSKQPIVRVNCAKILLQRSCRCLTSWRRRQTRLPNETSRQASKQEDVSQAKERWKEGEDEHLIPTDSLLKMQLVGTRKNAKAEASIDQIIGPSHFRVSRADWSFWSA